MFGTFKHDVQGVGAHFDQIVGLLMSSFGITGAPPGHRAQVADPQSSAAGGDCTSPPRQTIDQNTLLPLQLRHLRAAYVLPAQLLNAYLDWAAADEERHDARDEGNAECRSDLLRLVTADAYLAGLTMAMKAGLDAAVPILARYFRGVPRHATWGGYRDTGAVTGWMAVVVHGRHLDPLLARIDQANRAWFGAAFGTQRGQMISTSGELRWCYSELEKKLVAGRWRTPAGSAVHRYGGALMACLLDEWYRLLGDVLLSLTTRLPRAATEPWTPPSERHRQLLPGQR